MCPICSSALAIGRLADLSIAHAAFDAALAKYREKRLFRWYAIGSPRL